MHDPSTPFRLDFRLTESDVRHYCSAGLAGRCWRACRGRVMALFLLAALGSFLLATCLHSLGLRAGGLAAGTSLAVVAALAWGRGRQHSEGVCQLAGQMGLPRDLRLVASPGGIAEDFGPDAIEPARTFAWSEVVAISRVDHLTVIRLRPASAAFLVPDSAFASAEGRGEFEATLRAWKGAGSAVQEVGDRPGRDDPRLAR